MGTITSQAILKWKNLKTQLKQTLRIENLVYLYCDRDKSKERSKYIITVIDGDMCPMYLKMFTCHQIRVSSFKVKLAEFYRVLSEIQDPKPHSSLPRIKIPNIPVLSQKTQIISMKRSNMNPLILQSQYLSTKDQPITTQKPLILFTDLRKSPLNMNQHQDRSARVVLPSTYRIMCFLNYFCLRPS